MRSNADFNKHRKNARFWVHINEGLAKLTLKPGQSLTWSYGGPTDEGWSFHAETWEYDDDEGVIKYSIVSEGRDCDGRHGDYQDFECRLVDLHVFQATLWDDAIQSCVEIPGVRLPKWEKAGSSAYDQYAELSGY